MRVSFAFTMDCENLHHLSGVGGVADWASSERSIRGFADLLESAGHRATLFLCPETADAHRKWLPEIAARGHELALHFHPDSFADGRARGFGQLGAYPGHVQRRWLQAGIDLWSQALAQAPGGFRPGCFSMNDETFPLLVDLGFTHGSVSSPGRNEPALAAIWQPPLLDAHYAHAAQRSLPGDLDFVEIPLTVDWEARFPHRLGWDLPQELMVERGDVGTLTEVVRKNLFRQVEAGVPTPSICAATHNVWDYANPDEEKRRILSDLLDAIPPLAEAAGAEVHAGTTADIASRYRKAVPHAGSDE